MNKTDKICREVLNIHSFCKEQVVKQLTVEISNGNLDMSEDTLRLVASLVETTLETSFQKAFTKFQNNVEDLVASEVNTKNSKSK